MKKLRLLICLSLLTQFFINKAVAQYNIIETVAGTASTTGSSGDGGQATLARMNSNYLLAMDATGKIYIADNGNAKIRMFNPATGIITTVAGSTAGFSGDGGPATAAQLGGAGGGSNPGVVGVAIDPGANFLYISDGTNNRIRMVNMATGIITTICGNGTAGFAGDGGPATAATCQISGPRGIAVDGAGNVYFADNGSQRIRMITAVTGIISTIAGNGTAGYTADGVAASTTRINNVRGLTVDASGNVYIADQTNSRIRRIDAVTNIITTVAGNGTAGYTADGVLATTTRINLPTDVKFDAAGNMYIADVSNNRIRMVNTAGIISTVGGSGSTGFGIAGDGGLATAAAVRTSSPVAIAVEPGGRYFFFSDRGYSVLRQVRPNSTPYFTNGTRQAISMCQDATAFSINTQLAATDTDQKQTLTWSAGAWTPVNGTAAISGTATTNGGSVTPTGFTYTPTAGYAGMDSFIVQISDGFNVSFDTVIVTINPAPVVAPIAGPTAVCEGSTIVLTDVTAGGTWASTSGNASVVSGTVLGVTAGADLISYTVINPCGTTTVTQAITINPLPDAGAITGPTTVCVGSTITLTDAAPGGVWGAVNGNATVVGGVVTGVVAGTTDDITYTVTTSCGFAVATQTVSIITTLGGGTSLSGTPVLCQGATTTLTNPIAGGTWSESTGNTSVAGGVVTGISGGTDIITYALTNACGTNNITQSVTVNPLPNAGTITGLTSVCIGGTITLSNTVTGGTWSASNANATISPLGVVTGVIVGTDVISYSVTNACGTTVTTVTINIVTLPTAGAISGPSSVCQGSTITLTDPVAGGVWTAANANATVSATGVVTGVTAGTDIITYTVTFSCGTARATKSITINPLPTPAAISGSTSVCLAGTALYTDATPGGVWSASNANVSVSTTGVVSGLVVGPDTIFYSVTNSCGTVTVSQPMSVDPVVTPGISFTANPGFTTCPGTSVTYLSSAVNGGSSPVYQWKVNGVTLGSTSGFIYTPVNGDHISVKMTSSLACVTATSIADTQTAIVNPTLVPTAHITVGIMSDTVCIGDVATFTATSTNGGTAPVYQWFVNGSAYTLGSTLSYVPSNSDVVMCAVTSNYACPSPATVTSNSITMTVNTTELPTISITVSPGNPVCAGHSVTFSVHSLYGGLTPFYRWTKNGVNVATGPNYIYTPGTGDDVYAMLASSATCRTMDSVFSNHIIMDVVTPSVISVTITALGGTNIAVGQTDTFVAVVTGVTSPGYQWFENGTAIAGATNSTYVVTSSVAGSKIVNCVASSNDACANTGVSNHVSLNFSAVAVKEINAQEMEMKLIPNPNSGVFTLNLSSAVDEQVQVVVTNTVGEKVMEFTTSTNKATEVKMNQAAGIYYLTASTVHGKNVTKVIVE